MRQRLSAKTCAKLSRKTGLQVASGMVRGNTKHRKDLIVMDGSTWLLWPDGALTPPDGWEGPELPPPPLDFGAWTDERCAAASRKLDVMIGLWAKMATAEILERGAVIHVEQSAKKSGGIGNAGAWA